MCDLSGCDLQLAVFLFLLLFWRTKQQRTSPQPTSPRSLHLLHDANNHSIYSTTPTITPFTPRRHLPQQRYHHLHHSPFNEHRAVTISAGRMAEQQQQQQPAREGASPAKISCPKRPRKHSRLNLPPLVVVLSEKGEGWRVLSQLAGARCDASETGRGAERRGGKDLPTKGVDRESSGLSFEKR